MNSESPTPACPTPAELLAPDPWGHLRRFTAARLALGRCGASQPTAAVLDFRLAHALARDAVQAVWDPTSLTTALQERGYACHSLASDAKDRHTHLVRPDLGRRLAPADRERLKGPASPAQGPDLVVIISDGLAPAATRHAEPLLAHLLPLLQARGWTLAPLYLVPFGRVKLQDEIGFLLHARFSLMLLGERPGLGSPDSLGAYFTAAPGPEKTDADRNCLSNIRPEGLPPLAAAEKLAWLLEEARRTGLYGIHLKDTHSAAPALPAPTPLIP